MRLGDLRPVAGPRPGRVARHRGGDVGSGRTAIGGFLLADAIDPRTLDRENWIGHLLPALQAVAALPRITLDPAEIARVRSGQAIERSDVPPGDPPVEIAGIDSAGRLIAILTPRGPGLWGPTLIWAGKSALSLRAVGA